MRFLNLHRVTVDDPFWNRIIALVRSEVLPYQYEALHDRVPGAEKSYCIENFMKAAKADGSVTYPVDRWHYDEKSTPEGAFHGWVFQDSDAYKWLEAVAYALTLQPDAALEAKADGVIDLICAAQLPDGYLDTLYIINDRQKRLTNLRDYHELYCFGHLAEAAVAYYHATGKDRLLTAARRFADYICATFSGEKSGGYDGHEIAELALVKLYEATGEERYLSAARSLIDARGTRPYYFDREHGVTTEGEGYRYHQAHRPVREQREAVGHAVRAVYLYCGMADVARHTGDKALQNACQTLWNDITAHHLYITGGIGATVHGEAFSFADDLPNDVAYSETCASVGLVFFAQRMAQLEVQPEYAAVAERALYNTVLAGMGEDGKRFFYVNPLEVDPVASATDERKKHIRPVRQPWFSCACCPPNLARLVTSLGAYAYSENDTTLYIHQYLGGTADADLATLFVSSDYAGSGRVTVRVQPKKPMTLAVRIPDWVSDEGYRLYPIKKETELTLDFAPQPRLVQCSARVKYNIGKAAVMKGPFVYCAESMDNGAHLPLLSLKAPGAFTEDGEAVIAAGYRETPAQALYQAYQPPVLTPTDIRLIPYYRWGNRGENEMTVYLNIRE